MNEIITMQGYIKKWGNSLGVRIPIQMAKQLQLHSGSLVSLEIENGRIILQPSKYNLDTMLAKITTKNRNDQVFNDKPEGNEEW